jgi:hypothetical protein
LNASTEYMNAGRDVPCLHSACRPFCLESIKARKPRSLDRFNPVCNCGRRSYTAKPMLLLPLDIDSSHNMLYDRRDSP